MKKRVTIMAFVIPLLFASASFGEQMNGYREDYFLQRLEEISPLDALLPRSIKSDLAHLSVDQLDIAVTKMSADCETTITEVVVTLTDETVELKEWWESWNDPADSLPAVENHAVYYVSVGESVTEAFDCYSFDRGLCYILYGYHQFQPEGTVHLTLDVHYCIVTPQGREEKQTAIDLEYELPPLFRQYQYDVSREPIIDYPAVFRDAFPVSHQNVVGFQEKRLDGLFGQGGRTALLSFSIFPVAAPACYHPQKSNT